jgi:hypothetical protein
MLKFNPTFCSNFLKFFCERYWCFKNEFFSFLFTLFNLISVKQPKRSNKPSTAAWKERTADTHKQHMDALAAGENKCQVLLIGSSMFERWKTSGNFTPSPHQKKAKKKQIGG